MRDDTPVVTEKQINLSDDRLDRLLKIIFVSKNITVSEFERLYAMHWRRKYGDDIKKMNSNCNNAKSAFKKYDPLKEHPTTWAQFVERVFGVLNSEIVSLEVSIRNPKTNEIEHYSTLDNIEELKKKYGGEPISEEITAYESVEKYFKGDE